MKKAFPFTSAIFFCLMVFLFSCKKGDTGPAGSQGTAGNTILSGAGAPAIAVGNTGDFYLDLTALMLYGPKTAAGWGSGVLLKGAEGNANVKVDTFDIATTDWKYSAIYWFTSSNGTSQGYFSKYFDHTQALLTPDQIKTGAINVYATTNIDFETTTWTPLPYTFMENFSGAYTFNYAFNITEGQLRLFFFFSKVTGTPPTLSTFSLPRMKIKLVMIAGTIVSQVRDLTRQASPKFSFVE